MEEKRIADYEVFPSVVKCGEKSLITITPRGDHAHFKDGLIYTVKFVPTEFCNVHYELSRFEGNFNIVEVRPVNGAIIFTYCFTEEQEWSIIVQDKNIDSCAIDQQQKVFHIYSILPDLYGKKAYKGDLHVHSNRSDGNEEPAIVAANYRKAGFDFIAITDHHRWYPSREAIDRFNGIDIDLKLFLGEEVHVPGNYIHAVNFGGNFSVNELYEDNKEQIDAEMKENAKKISVPAGINALEYCYRKWIADNILKGSGLSILVHPYWYFCNEFNMQTNITEYLFETGCYDAFEILGGQSAWENNLQTALYYEQRAKGIKIPIVGSSDSHGTEPPVWFNCIKTILLSENLELETIRKNIKELYSVAVGGTSPESMRVDGTFRLVKYAMFLLKYYFPRHDELCIEEGILMKNHVCGDENAREQLSRYKGRTARFAEKFFGF